MDTADSEVDTVELEVEDLEVVTEDSEVVDLVDIDREASEDLADSVALAASTTDALLLEANAPARDTDPGGAEALGAARATSPAVSTDASTTVCANLRYSTANASSNGQAINVRKRTLIQHI